VPVVGVEVLKISIQDEQICTFSVQHPKATNSET
jgi:hypothetical protein